MLGWGVECGFSVCLCAGGPVRRWDGPASSWSSKEERSWWDSEYEPSSCEREASVCVKVCVSLCVCVSWTVGSILVWRGWTLCPTLTWLTQLRSTCCSSASEFTASEWSHDCLQHDDTDVPQMFVLTLPPSISFHLDHCGALPWFLQKTSFKGRTFMTHATKAIYRWLLSDYVKVRWDSPVDTLTLRMFLTV